MSIAGVLLAGGQSRRMGQDKCRLTLPDTGLNLLQRGIKVLSACGATELWISHGRASRHNLANEALMAKKVQPIKDQFVDCGPLGGIHATLLAGKKAYGLDGLIIVPVDMPALSPQLLQYLIKVGIESKKSCYFKCHFLPLYLNLKQQSITHLIDIAEASLQKSNNLSLRQYYQTVGFTELAIEQDIFPLLENINFPDQWQTWCTSRTLVKNDVLSTIGDCVS